MAKSKFLRAIVVAMALAAVPLCASPAQAESTNQLDISKLPKADADKILEIVNSAQTTTQTVKDMIPKREDLSAYAELGRNMAETVAEAAKTLGIEVVKFSQTDVGWWLTVILFYKLIGADIAYSLFSNAFIVVYLVAVIRIWWKIYYKMCMVERVDTSTTERDRLNDTGKSTGLKETFTQVVVHSAANDDDSTNLTRFLMFLALIIVTVPAWIMLAN